MEKQQLDRALNGGIVVLFENLAEQYQFMQEMKNLGGKWLSGKEILLPDKPEDLWPAKRIHVGRDYVLSFVSGICFHYGAYPTVAYRKFSTDNSVIRYDDIRGGC